MPHAVENMYSLRQVPWHGLGRVLPSHPKTKEELLVAAGLDWTVEACPVAAILPDGSQLVAEDKKAMVRTTDRTLLSVMGTGYVPIQPSELVDFAMAVLDADVDALEFETAMSLAGGRVNTLMCKVPKEIRIGGTDAVHLYVGFVNSHDGSMRFGAHVTPIREVCMNTLNLALRAAAQSWSVKHTASATKRIDEARRTLRLTWEYADQFELHMNALLDEEFTKSHFEQMIRHLFPKADSDPAPFSREQYAMLGLLESSPTIDDGIRFTKYGALNAVTEHLDWGRRFNEGGAPVAEKRTMATLFGDSKKQADRVTAYLLV